jgi:metal-responsive CopG/Arc/MetJ family transcriptional regulator
MSIKYQITLPEDLAAELKGTAERLKIPLAELIRETMQRRLQELKARDRGDPFASITGLVNSDETDLSQRVDEILYGGSPRK